MYAVNKFLHLTEAKRGTEMKEEREQPHEAVINTREDTHFMAIRLWQLCLGNLWVKEK